MRDDIARALAGVKIGTPTTPTMIADVRAIYTAAHESVLKGDVQIVSDIAYGPDERHRLDVFTATHAEGSRPVVIFVHGGGFIGGNKRTANTPYYENVGRWAASAGFVGVTMNYRLAPAHPYPAGAEDVAAAVSWCIANIAAHGGDPASILLLGQSAGATHVATYGARPDLHPGGHCPVLGIAVLSGVYDFTTFAYADDVSSYAGADAGSRARASARDGLINSRIPLLISIAEFDTPPFHEQAWALAQGLFERDGRVPNIVVLRGHNHLSQIVHLGAPGLDDDTLSASLVDFVRALAAVVPVAG